MEQKNFFPLSLKLNSYCQFHWILTDKKKLHCLEL